MMFLNTTENNLIKSILVQQIVKLKSMQTQIQFAATNLSKNQFIVSQQRRYYEEKLKQHQQKDRFRKQLLQRKKQQSSLLYDSLCLQKQQMKMEMIELQQLCQNIRQLNNQRKIYTQESASVEQKLENLSINASEVSQTELKIRQLIEKIVLQEKTIVNMDENKSTKLQFLIQKAGTELDQLKILTNQNQQSQKIFDMLSFALLSEKQNQQQKNRIVSILQEQIQKKKSQQQKVAISVCSFQQTLKDKNIQLQLQSEENSVLQSKINSLQISQAKQIQILMELSHESVKVKAEHSIFKQKNKRLNQKILDIIKLTSQMHQQYEAKQYEKSRQITEKLKMQNFQKNSFSMLSK